MDADRNLHPDCLICQKQNGRLPLPGGAIYVDGLVFACHAHSTPDRPAVYLGWLSVETRRHIEGLADLSEAEGQALGEAEEIAELCERIRAAL